MPTTNRGYPYETGADEPGHSLTGGSSGGAPILAQVVDADVAGLDTRLTDAEGAAAALTGRVTATESDITALDTRVSASEGDITALDGRVTTAEGNITALDGRVSANEDAITTLQGDVTGLDTRLTTAEGNITTVTGDLTAHEAATTSVHGITDTANLVYTDDARLSDARTPTAHAPTHATGGADPIAAADIGAYPASGGTIDGDVNVAGLLGVAGINGLEPVQFVGRTTAPGAPSTGTFAVGDLAIDSAGVWHLCTAAGTPGTWT